MASDKKGRPTSLTPETGERIIGFLRLGNYIETACNASGIHKDSFYEWLKRAKTGEEPFAKFASQVDEAVALAEARDLQTIQKASGEQWQAAAWRLERRYPERWGRRDPQRIELTGKGGGPITLSLEDLDKALSAGESNAASLTSVSEPGRTDDGEDHSR